MSKSAHEVIRVRCVLGRLSDSFGSWVLLLLSLHASARVRACVVICLCPFFLLVLAAALAILALISIVYEM